MKLKREFEGTLAAGHLSIAGLATLSIYQYYMIQGVIDDGIIESVNVKNRYKEHASQHGGQTVNRKMVFGGNLYMVE